MLAAEDEHVEILTHSPGDAKRDRWSSAPSPTPASGWATCATVLDAAALDRATASCSTCGVGPAHVGGAAPRAEGGVYALARTRAMPTRCASLPNACRRWSARWSWRAARRSADIPRLAGRRTGGNFDAIVGYNSIFDDADKAAACATLASLLARVASQPGGRVPQHTQRLCTGWSTPARWMPISWHAGRRRRKVSMATPPILPGKPGTPTRCGLVGSRLTSRWR